MEEEDLKRRIGSIRREKEREREKEGWTRKDGLDGWTYLKVKQGQAKAQSRGNKVTSSINHSAHHSGGLRFSSSSCLFSFFLLLPLFFYFYFIIILPFRGRIQHNSQADPLPLFLKSGPS